MRIVQNDQKVNRIQLNELFVVIWMNRKQLLFVYIDNYNPNRQSISMINGPFTSFLKHTSLFKRVLIYSKTNFSTQKKEADRVKQKQNEDRLQKQKEVQFRIRTLQNAQIKMINDRIDTTKGNFRPVITYIKLYKKNVILAFLFAVSIIFICAVLTLVEIFQDPFTKRKKLILISNNWEKSLDSLLRQIVQSQLTGQFSQVAASPSLTKKSKQLQQLTKKITGRQYRIVVVPSEDEVITILPQSILISKNILLSGSIRLNDLQNVILLLQTLFVQKLHIKQLAPQYILFFLKLKVRGSSEADITLTNIYSRPYSNSQVSTALNHIQQFYNIPSQTIRLSLLKLTKHTVTTPYALKNRFKTLA